MVAEFADWEVHSSNPQDMTSAVNFLGFNQGDGFTKSGIRYSINIYGTKYILSTTQTFINRFGQTQFLNIAQPGVYAILRWFSPTVFPPPGVTIPPQVTVIPLPADSPYVFA